LLKPYLPSKAPNGHSSRLDGNKGALSAIPSRDGDSRCTKTVATNVLFLCSLSGKVYRGAGALCCSASQPLHSVAATTGASCPSGLRSSISRSAR
jgi:hypothetical protein